MVRRIIRRVMGALLLGALFFGAGLWVAQRLPRFRTALPDPPALVNRLRDVARLETLEASVYKKVSLEPDPQAQKTVWGDLVEWTRYTVVPPRGRAIIFADVQLGIDLSRLNEDSMRIHGDTIELVLPPLQAQVDLRPGETEVIGSNLDSAQTALLFDKARSAFAYEVTHDPKLRERAVGATERALRAFLMSVGFREVRFVAAFQPSLL